jgi:hypothetical protein
LDVIKNKKLYQYIALTFEEVINTDCLFYSYTIFRIISLHLNHMNAIKRV